MGRGGGALPWLLAAVLLGPSQGQLYSGGEEVCRRANDYAEHQPFQTASEVGRRIREAWPWLKFVAWPWVNELVDVDAEAWASAARESSIADRLNETCLRLKKWSPQGVNVDCVRSIQMLGCDFIDLVVSGLTDCKRDCACRKWRAKELEAKRWSANVIDAFAKLPSGIGQGNFLWMGDWDSCVNTDVIAGEHNNSKGVPLRYKGHYCTVSAYQAVTPTSYAKSVCSGKVSPKVHQCRDVGASINFGVCAPQSCSLDDLHTVVSTLTKTFKIYLCNIAVTKEESPSIADHPESITWAVLLAIFGVVIILATAFDELVYAPAIEHLPDKVPPNIVVSTEEDPDPHPSQPSSLMTKASYYKGLSWYLKSLLCFSATRNLGKIMNTDAREGQLGVVHSIRVLSMWWVILGHCYLMALGYEDNVSIMITIPKYFFFEIVNNATVAVDSFFVLSGFLLAYLFLKRAADKPEQLKSPGFWLMFYIHRIFRLTPPYMLILGTIATIWPLMGSGPLWKGFQHEYVRSCGSVSILTNLFYLNNFFRLEDQCMGWSWYLANDMQFFCLSPFLLLLLHFYPGLAMGVSAALLLLTTLVRAVFDVVQGYPPTVINTVDVSVFDKAQEYFRDFYVRPYFRYGPFVLGLLLGWLYLRAQKRRFRIRPWLRFFGWIGLFFVAFAVVFGLYNYANMAKAANYSDTAKALYNGLNREVFGAVVAGAIFLCLPDSTSGILDSMARSFLEWPGWQPLSRLTYCTYLIHPMVIMYFYGMLKTPEHMSDYNMFYVFLSSTATSYALAIVLSLAFEAPFMGLDKLWLDPSNWRSSEPKSGLAPVTDKIDDLRFRLQESLRSLNHSTTQLNGTQKTGSQPVSMAELEAKAAQEAMVASEMPSSSSSSSSSDPSDPALNSPPPPSSPHDHVPEQEQQQQSAIPSQ